MENDYLFDFCLRIELGASEYERNMTTELTKAFSFCQTELALRGSDGAG